MGLKHRRQGPRRSPRRAEVSYIAECFDCGWSKPSARDTQTAREHAERFNHRVVCDITRELVYEGRS